MMRAGSHPMRDSRGQRKAGMGWSLVSEALSSPGSARLQLVDGVALLRPDEQVFAAMLHGWSDPIPRVVV